MIKKTIEEINEIYDLELERILKTIRKENVKSVLLQFPEGMKPYAQQICSFVEENSNCQCFIWLGSCYGACDVPLDSERLGIDLVIQFGHSSWNYKKDVEVLK